MVLVDGSSWEQFFGDNWKIILNSMDVNKVINLDHHVPDEIHAAIPERCINIKTSCTAQLLYDYFIKPSDINLPPYIADALYIALIYDSRMFKNEIYQGQYKFAEELLSFGVNHLKAVDTNYDLKEIDFLVWAVEHTEFMPDLHLTILYIDSLLNVELQEKLGKNWLEYDSLYKETIERQVKGYNYGIILIDNMDGHIRLNWRTRNFGNNISIAEVARKAGFNAGGHRNAGGGSFPGTFEDAKARLIQEIYKELKKG
jgi:nanoRNase/pAp phosphatase (c-di-AMP/oligoRNAs hydrolase)